MLSSSAHNHCSIYWQETHKYSLESWEGYLHTWYSKFQEFSFRILVKNSEWPVRSNLSSAEFQQHSSTSIKHISWVIDRMRTCEYRPERRESHQYLCYSTLCQNSATIVLVLYFLTAARGQVRFDSSTRIVVSMCCWQSRTPSLTMLLQKCMVVHVLSLWLKSRHQDLVCWHQKFFHKMASIHCVNAHIWVSLGGHMPSAWIALLYPRASFCGPNCHPLIGQDIFYGRFHLSFNSWLAIFNPTLPTCIVMQQWVHYR
jgi:hypothetical protein